MVLKSMPAAEDGANLHHNFSYGAFGEGGRGEGAGYTARWGGLTDARAGVLNWNRWYGPASGKWKCRDSIGIAGGSNLYVYAKNSEINITDFSGLCPKSPEECWADYQKAIIEAFLPTPLNMAQLMASSGGTLASNTVDAASQGLSSPNKSSIVRAAAWWKRAFSLAEKLAKAAGHAASAWSIGNALEDFKKCMKTAVTLA